ncbi:B12-binding domain-containing radical SAM protein [Candidatus Poribacteria bacterium]|nr:B12-binding domain-containing radical SAM protein [Candidatus Poribacteria bacterium]
MSKGRLLLINPWIYDFAAFNLWVEPIGLLSIGSVLRQHGYALDFIDCLDRYNPELLKLQGLSAPIGDAYGTGKYSRERVEKPEAVKHVPRHFCRYGITPEIFETELDKREKPDAILVTSKMTYWYPGPHEVIRRVKRRYPDVPVGLGGTYASLCYQHALEKSPLPPFSKGGRGDFVVKGEGEFPALKRIDQLTGNRSDYSQFPLHINDYPFPAHDLIRRLDFAAILTARGCPMTCSYCAVRLVNPGFRQRDPEQVVDELQWCYDEFGARNFAFYDDALLLNARKHIHKILDLVLDRGLRCYFHTPNSMHAQVIDAELAHKMYAAGFKTVRISLESSDVMRQKLTGPKVTNNGFTRAVENLKAAGFTAKEIGVYLMMGLPGQPLAEVIESIRFVHERGVPVKLAQFTPIPGTVEWERAITNYGFDPDSDALLHNNTIFSLQLEPSIAEEQEAVKRLATEGNRRLTQADFQTVLERRSSPLQ